MMIVQSDDLLFGSPLLYVTELYYQKPLDFPPGGFLTRMQDRRSPSSSSAIRRKKQDFRNYFVLQFIC